MTNFQEQLLQLANIHTAAVRQSIQQTRPFPGPVGIHTALQVSARDILAFFNHQNLYPKFFWKDRDGAYESCGIGGEEILYCDHPGELPALMKMIEERTGCHREFRYYGGQRFNTGRPADTEWAPFHTCFYFLPKLEIIRRGNKFNLALNTLLDLQRNPAGQIDLENFIRKLVPHGPDCSRPLPGILRHRTFPEKSCWLNQAAAVSQAITEGSLKKAVLAACKHIIFSGQPEAGTILNRFRALPYRKYFFCLEPSAGTSWLGQSPERLFFKSGNRLLSEAMAGTKSGQSFQKKYTPDTFGIKEDLENKLVSRWLEYAFREICTEFKVDQAPSIITLNKLKHLCRHFSGTIRPGTETAEILLRLNATPAVSGFPKQESISLLESMESFDRGWYAGPVGWISKSESEFCVGIRSGLLSGNLLKLYAGAGIVEGSLPENEWKEVNHKLDNFLAPLQLDAPLLPKEAVCAD